MSYDSSGGWDEDQTEAVIDHLDVIGMTSFSSALVQRVTVPSVDPQVATVSNLTNAANSIMMCVVTGPPGYLIDVHTDHRCQYIP